MPTALASPAQNYDGHPVRLANLTFSSKWCIITGGTIYRQPQ